MTWTEEKPCSVCHQPITVQMTPTDCTEHLERMTDGTQALLRCPSWRGEHWHFIAQGLPHTCQPMHGVTGGSALTEWKSRPWR